MENKIQKLLEKILPTEVHDTINVRKFRIFKNDEPSIAIQWAASNFEINGVEGQKPLAVSLRLSPEMELEPASFGGMGGRTIYFKVLPEDDTYNALHGVNIPFRKPKRNEEAVLRAIGRFAQRWMQTIRDNTDRLRFEDEVDYSWV